MRKARLDFGSWSTFGQTALLIVAALLVSQVFAFFVLHNFIDQWQRSVVLGPSIAHFAEVAGNLQTTAQDRREKFLDGASTGGSEFVLERTLAFSPMFRERPIESELSAALNKRGVRFLSVYAMRRGGPFDKHRWPMHEDGARPFPMRSGGAPADALAPVLAPPIGDSGRMPQGGPPGYWAPWRMFDQHAGGPPPGRMNEVIGLAALLPDGNWLAGRFVAVRPLPVLLNPIFVSQIVLFSILLCCSLFWASRISRPLRTLSRAAESLRPQEQLEPIPVTGPRDVRAAIASFNTMAQRVRDLLQEKDRMLSAIGHDLRTPLASLRVRAESMEPESERERVIETIEEMSRMVEEILGLARLGHSTEKKELVDLSALADALVEEYRELGKDVSFEEAPRTPLKMQAGLVRRLLRNLIDNAIKYGERARVSLQDTGQAVELRVDDDGPGIPEAEIGNVIEPFMRLENSRSRETGGLGLGLSIAHAVALSQGAELVLQNRAERGLRAIVRWPAP